MGALDLLPRLGEQNGVFLCSDLTKRESTRRYPAPVEHRRFESDACGGKVWLVHQENVCDRLAPEKGPRKLTRQQIERTVKVLTEIRHGAASIYQRPDRPTAAARSDAGV